MFTKKTLAVIALIVFVSAINLSFTNEEENKQAYSSGYFSKLEKFKACQQSLYDAIQKGNLSNEKDVEEIRQSIQEARFCLKGLDFFFRYLEPIAYKKINGPLPVEWETEVFEKWEAPYKREGAGLTLAALYLDEENLEKDSLLQLIHSSVEATKVFNADSITRNFNDYHSFFLCNRLFLLNLATIYTTGFECPDTSQIIPELTSMLDDVSGIYQSFNQSFSSTPLNENYLSLYQQLIQFCKAQPTAYSSFDHFNFIRNYINPLYLLNQKMINRYKVVSKSMVDYALNKKEISIFNKSLYHAQNTKGIFLRVYDEETLALVNQLGKQLFYDPILSGNNQRTCATCHKPTEFFTDTLNPFASKFDSKELLSRNTPSLINAPYNHLLMLDGKHISLQEQCKAVITNKDEMACDEKEVMQKILSCAGYKKGFQQLLKYTPQEIEIFFDHIASAITYYYSKFSGYNSPFDEAMNENKPLSSEAKQGFNLFMSKAQCGTCHFPPQFNGVKPPYAGSEFEVLGVPSDTAYKKLSTDKGRFDINPAKETANAFRTGTVRNAAHTKPYMHNGVFTTLEEVIDFYDGGGGAGRKLSIGNQTLSSDSLRLTPLEKKQLIAFIHSLNEKIEWDEPPAALPSSKNKKLNNRKPGGDY